MISILTGLPRTGKSYRAVWQINNSFLDFKSPIYSKYRYCLTNIGGFKFEEINKDLEKHPVVLDDDIFIKETIYLDWEIFFGHIKKMHEMALADKSDDELVRYAQYHKISPALIVIDEAYRFYKKKSDPTLVWLNGYHGHLGLDLIFIIHKPTMMNSDYVAHTEEFIDAQPKSKSLSNNTFRYIFYPTTSYNKAEKYHTDKLTADAKIFGLYKSGDLHNPKKILYKFIGYMVAAVLFMGIVGYFFYARLSKNLAPTAPLDSDHQEIVVNPLDPVPVPSKSLASDFVTLIIRCDGDNCARVDPTVQTHYINRQFFDNLISYVPAKLLSGRQSQILDVMFTDYLYVIPSESLKYFPMWTIPAISPNESGSVSTGSKPMDGVIK